MELKPEQWLLYPYITKFYENLSQFVSVYSVIIYRRKYKTQERCVGVSWFVQVSVSSVVPV